MNGFMGIQMIRGDGYQNESANARSVLVMNNRTPDV